MAAVKEIIASIKEQSGNTEKNIFIFPFSVYKNRILKHEIYSSDELIYDINLHQYDAPIFFDEKLTEYINNVVKEYIGQSDFPVEKDDPDKNEGLINNSEETNGNNNKNFFYKGFLTIDISSETEQSIHIKALKTEVINGKILESPYINNAINFDPWLE